MKHHMVVSVIMVAVLLLSGLACLTPSSPTPTSPQASQLLHSDKQRVTSPVASQSDLASLVEGNNAFAFDAYQQIKGDKNIFFSPYSISLALAMTYAGARGDTEKQMATTLHYTLPQDKLHPAFNSLDLELGQRGQGARGKDDKGFRLNIVNAIWGQKDYTFLQDFLDTLAENYGAGLRLLDFKNAPEPSRVTINDWVAAQTEGRIEGLIPPDDIDPLTRLVLTNAIYFNAAWQYTFEKCATTDGTFHLLDGGEVTVPMMWQTARLNYTWESDYQAVELPYDGGELSMVVLLPDPGEFTAFEQSLDSGKIEGMIKSLASKEIEVDLTMPRFEFTTPSINLKKALSNMGMPVAFISPPGFGPCSPKYANFSGMDMKSKCDLYISSMVQKAFISVDERGTEAAIATYGGGDAPGGPQGMFIDRPFIFLIRDIQTGTILFVGRVMNPSE